jgi:hypothetical protein
MPNASTGPFRSPSLFWGAALIVTSLLTIGGGAIIWSNRDRAPAIAKADPQAANAEPQRSQRFLPRPEMVVDARTTKLHEVAFAVENGTAVVKIKVVAGGDELIVDANTGRLIETRPGRPSAPPPLGKFAAPFAPMM